MVWITLAITLYGVVGFAFFMSNAHAFDQAIAPFETSSLDSQGQKKESTKKSALQENAERQLVRVGVLVRGGVADCAIRYKSTADYLTSKIDGYRFAIVPIRFDDFSMAVVRGEVDFTLCNPLLYTQLQALGEVSAIATMRDHFDGVNFSQLGGVIFCRRDRDDMENISDIKGKSFAAVSEDSFGGWIAEAEFLLSCGIQPQKDASDFAFLRTNSAVVRAVTDGVYDVGAVRTGTLERMAKTDAIKMSDYRVFNATAPTADFPFVSSTRLYPEWAFAKTNTVSDALAAKVSIALYEMPESSKAASRGRYSGWIVPASYRSVWECIQKVRGPLVEENGGVFYGLWQTCSLFSLAMVMLIGALFSIVALKKKLHATETLIDHHTETVIMKDKSIRDLRRRIAVIAGEEHEDVNVIRHDYRIEYVTPEWEAKYGPGVGRYCYDYFANLDSPCEQCGLREAVKTQGMSLIEKSFTRESGRPLKVTTIPLSKDKDGTQLFGQTYCDVLTQNRKTTLSVVSQERETRYLLIKGALAQTQENSDDATKILREVRRLVDEAVQPQRVDVNRLVRQVAGLTAHLWQPVADISFDLSPENPTIWATDLDLRMVIANLILNAVRCLECALFSSKHKGVITLSTQLQGDSAFLMVMDNGDGQSLLTAKDLSAEPGRNEDNRDVFIKMGLLPSYARVFEKWNGKLQVNRPDENRTIRTAVVPAASDLVIPPATDEPAQVLSTSW